MEGLNYGGIFILILGAELRWNFYVNYVSAELRRNFYINYDSTELGQNFDINRVPLNYSTILPLTPAGRHSPDPV
jgi:hypothetical protein